MEFLFYFLILKKIQKKNFFSKNLKTATCQFIIVSRGSLQS